MKLELDLELRMALDAIWIVAESTVVWTNAWFGVTDVPRFRTQNSQKRRWIHRPCTHLTQFLTRWKIDVLLLCCAVTKLRNPPNSNNAQASKSLLES